MDSRLNASLFFFKQKFLSQEFGISSELTHCETALPFHTALVTKGGIFKHPE